jgi:hypothetical protein
MPFNEGLHPYRSVTVGALNRGLAIQQDSLKPDIQALSRLSLHGDAQASAQSRNRLTAVPKVLSVLERQTVKGALFCSQSPGRSR